ncbi:MAG: Si-specific NAD(P)(+) transhydrogenase [Nitrospiraceae bacterium]|nr:Si-specific NAD(P)(+) transhydrogenase [Nitrospiraceae bacterium]
MSHFDMLVIGSGPAGQKAAIQAAKLGKKVGLIERKNQVGGVCTNTGTIPSKSLREAVLYLSGFHQRALYGSSYRVKQDITMEDLSYRANHVIRREIEIIHNQMSRNNIQLLTGTAAFLDPHRLHIEGPLEQAEHSADVIVIACGTVPAHPAHIPFDDQSIIDTDGLLAVARLPRTITIIGGGVIGTEYASILATMGIHVTLIERRPRLLEFVDQETIEALQYHMRSIGVTLRFNEEVVSVERRDGQVVVGLKSGKEIGATTVLYSVGRMGATQALNLPAIGITADERGRLTVNENYQTAIPHIYAAGDVIGFPALASTSMQQGRLAACHAFGLPCRSQTELMPLGIYSIPEISMVGPNEDDLTRNGVPYSVGIARYREIARGQLIGDEIGMLKLLFHNKTRELLGVHAIGEGATELIHIGQAVMSFHGQIDYFVETVFNYPTLAECYRVAALDGINRLPRPWAPRT